MSLRLWDGDAAWTTGAVYLWNGTELEPGVVRQYPWESVQPPIVPDFDGGTPGLAAWESTLDGGAPATDYGALPDFDGGAP